MWITTAYTARAQYVVAAIVPNVPSMAVITAGWRATSNLGLTKMLTIITCAKLNIKPQTTNHETI